LARAALHFWEEPPVSGTSGSGAVFFSNCSLRCAFCQNHLISHGGRGADLDVQGLVRVIRRVSSKGPHNINMVSASHYMPQAAAALHRSAPLPPVVWNSNAYEDVRALRMLEGLVDVYLPDLKYRDESLAVKYSSAPGYFKAATAAILEMYRQCGDPVFNEDGIIERGLIVRHLVLPGHTDDTKAVLRWVAGNLPKTVYVSLMAQYVPTHRAGEFPEIDRTLTEREYNEVVDYFIALGLENGYRQGLESAATEFTPDFDLEGIL
jgi:putative pyruvate formate lyase activating enzyme